MSVRFRAALAGLFLLAAGAGGAAAQGLACGAPYTVTRGDTLQQITNRAYGPGKSYQLLYSANRAVIGGNPSLIEVGMVLQVPCLEGQSAAAPTPIAPLQTTGVLPPPVKRKLRITTSSDWAPYHDQTQAEGGMLVEVLNVALSRVMETDEYRIDFINDWAAQLQPLIADLAYDVSFSWYKPNCAVADKLEEGSKFRCYNLAWSDPLFEQLVSYYTRAGETPPATHHDLFGKSVCIPSGYSRFYMEEVDLVEPNIRLATPPSPTDCFRMLIDGQTDAVVISTTVADDSLAKLNAQGRAVENSHLAHVLTLHAVTSIEHPRKEEILGLINEGLKRIREDGAWFEIVQRHLVEHAKKTAASG